MFNVLAASVFGGLTQLASTETQAQTNDKTMSFTIPKDVKKIRVVSTYQNDTVLDTVLPVKETQKFIVSTVS